MQDIAEKRAYLP